MKAQQGHRRPLARSGWLPKRSGLWLIWLMAQGSWLTASAETEVSGAVSGEWTREGSPYIVVDSTWVEENASLLITEGVDVYFNEGQGLYVFGRLNGSGTEEDSVRIRVSEDVEHWRGLRFCSERNWTEWDYSSVICPDTIFFLSYRSVLRMWNCNVIAESKIVERMSNSDNEWSLVFEDCFIKGGYEIRAIGGSIISYNTFFDFSEVHVGQSHGLGAGSFNLRNCEIIGGMFTGGVLNSFVENCRFIKPADSIEIEVNIPGPAGRLIDSYIEGSVTGGYPHLRGFQRYLNNTILGDFSIRGSSMDMDALIQDCDIRGMFEVNDADSIVVKNNRLGRLIRLRDIEYLLIDSCYFLYDHYSNQGQLGNRLDFRNVTNLTFTRNVADNIDQIRMYIINFGLFDHNTFQFHSEPYTLACLNPYNANTLFTNNILVSDGGGIFYSNFEWNEAQAEFNFNYNDIFGFDFAFRFMSSDTLLAFDDSASLDTFNVTNLIANPFINWDDIVPCLNRRSPCIDAGDPDFELDSDRTRTDVGAVFYDQKLYIDNDTKLIRDIPSISVYPNPFNDYMRVNYSIQNSQSLTITVVDILGRKVKYFESLSSSGTSTLNFNLLPSGNYILTVRNGEYERSLQIQCLR